MKLIGHDGCSEGADAVLQGTTYTSHMKITPLQRTYFSNLQFKKNKTKSNIKDTVSIKDMNDRYKTWKESTSTSPSNRHLDHYKSLLSSDGTKQYSTNTFQTQCGTYFLLRQTSRSIPLNHWIGGG